MIFNIKKLIFVTLIPFFFFSCTPKDMKVNLYTADIEAVKNGETIGIPIELNFSMPGKDDKNLLQKAEVIVKKYLPSDSSFTITQGKYSNFFVVKTSIPLTKSIALKLNSDKNLGVLTYYPSKRGPKFGSIQFNPSKNLISKMNKELRKVNFMLSLNLPATNYRIRIISDSKDPFKVNSYSTWVSKKPFVFYTKTLNRREEVELVFKGSSSSIYSQIPIFFNFETGK